MRRHLLVGRMGMSDTRTVAAASDEVVTTLQLLTTTGLLDHGLGEALDDLRSLGLFPTEIAVDLMVLAAQVYAADTRVRRTDSQDGWTREIRLVVPVSDPDRWRATADVLERMLKFLTGDQWTLGFHDRPIATRTLVRHRGSSRPVREHAGVCLFSGGLDSLIGAIDATAAGSDLLFVSHASEGATSDAQSHCFDSLVEHHAPRALSRLRLWMSFPRDLVARSGVENTTRGRSFLFIAAAAFAGSTLNRDFLLLVPENGFIALNVPLDVLRLGALSTRTTHPFYLAKWSEVLRGLGIPGTIENPYWNRTKGEMVSACVDRALLASLAPRSMSCSSPTKGRWRRRGIEHCGYCVPCIIRRAALTAGLPAGSDPTTYSIPNLSSRRRNTLRAAGREIRSFQLAAERVRRNPNLARSLIRKPGPLSGDAAHMDALAGVYRRGLAEIGAFLDGVRAAPVSA